MVNKVCAEVASDEAFVSGDIVPVKVVLEIEDPIVIQKLALTLSGYTITRSFEQPKQSECSSSSLAHANDYCQRFLLRVFELSLDSEIQLSPGRYEIESRVEVPDKNSICESIINMGKSSENDEEEEQPHEPSFLLPPSFIHETEEGDFIAISYLILPLVNEDAAADPMSSSLDPKITYSSCQVKITPSKTTIPPEYLTEFSDFCSIETEKPQELVWKAKVDAFGLDSSDISLGSRLTACAFFRCYPMKSQGDVRLTRYLAPGDMLNRSVSFSLGLSFPRRTVGLPDKIKVHCHTLKSRLVEQIEYPKVTHKETDSRHSEDSQGNAAKDIILSTTVVKTHEMMNQQINKAATFEIYHISQEDENDGKQCHYIFQCPAKWFEVMVPQTFSTFATTVLSHHYTLVTDFTFSTVDDPKSLVTVSVAADVFVNDDFSKNDKS
ncbi:hypothetical protein FT663_03476 [Candidozyma haemuli var. vulneris]|uniref:Uncharacterized protein n=1 Tax=Candidozyma haemuli TaxID=45357 RepID=A0A2V1AZI5_9ASCO|nr:hypothetical protein CXQ85_003770 [[Candida] haemuloni]KAF3988541.1 hypothetical protein FT662_03346 [[Candida] haemuloni var. vulneris]KAF3989740.1 hypothetical protein FT663_03476 [[Candida] haemuloni var. vulneris]PVH23480.1 hypothetical protein CXQ85_003770 [[Candida] haemuloni]